MAVAQMEDVRLLAGPTVPFPEALGGVIAGLYVRDPAEAWQGFRTCGRLACSSLPRPRRSYGCACMYGWDVGAKLPARTRERWRVQSGSSTGL